MALLTFDDLGSDRVTAEQSRNFFERMCPAIAVLSMTDLIRKKTYGPIGHGFIVGSSGTILTASHVVKKLWESNRAEAREKIVASIMKAGSVQQYRARIINYEPLWDLASLKIFEALDGGSSSTSSESELSFDYVGLGNTDIDVVVGKWCYTITATNLMTFGMKMGRITNPRMRNVDEEYREATFTEVGDMHAIGGESGSAVLNSRGSVIGLLSIAQIMRGRDYAVHLDHLRSFLARST